MNGAGVSFIHLSDCHLGEGPEARVYGADTGSALEAVVAHINTLDPPPSFVIFGGDLVSPDLGAEPFAVAEDAGHRKYDDAYAYFRKIVAPLQVPAHFAVGNHDSRASLRKVLLDEEPRDEPCDYHFEVNGCVFIVLDTQDPGHVAGLLADGQLGWLERTLEGISADKPVVIVCHHPPVAIDIPYLDQFRLQEPERLFAVLERFSNVRCLLCGHVHNERSLAAPLPILITPSTGFQFRMQDGEIGVVPGEPAYRVVTLDDRDMQTRVIHVDAR